MRRLRDIGLGLVVCVLTVSTAAVAAAKPVGGNNAHRFVTVMTRNLDEGTDFGYIQAAAAGQLPLSEAVALTYSEVVASDVCDRAALAADEIAASRPDLVSVQEAAVWPQNSGHGVMDHEASGWPLTL